MYFEVKEQKEFHEFVSRRDILITAVHEVHEKLIMVVYQMEEEMMEPLTTVSVPFAAFTTSHARLRLLEFLEMVPPEKLLYADTGKLTTSNSETLKS